MATKVPKIILEDFDDMLAFEQKEPAALAPAAATEMDFARISPRGRPKNKLRRSAPPANGAGQIPGQKHEGLSGLSLTIAAVSISRLKSSGTSRSLTR